MDTISFLNIVPVITSNPVDLASISLPRGFPRWRTAPNGAAFIVAALFRGSPVSSALYRIYDQSGGTGNIITSSTNLPIVLSTQKVLTASSSTAIYTQQKLYLRQMSPEADPNIIFSVYITLLPCI